MDRRRADVPELVPQLSRGKHRSPRKGACFMEMASYLAGEQWSDHPACTHPLLAMAARLVNDHTSDAARGRLIGLVPSVIGLTSADPRVDVAITLRSAATALPVVAADRQRVLAVGLLTVERAAEELAGQDAGSVRRRGREALAQVPATAAWAGEFARQLGIKPRNFRRHVAPHVVRHAVAGVARACVPDPDVLLYELLTGAIEDTWAIVGGTPDGERAPVEPRPATHAAV